MPEPALGSNRRNRESVRSVKSQFRRPRRFLCISFKSLKIKRSCREATGRPTRKHLFPSALFPNNKERLGDEH